MLTKVIMCNVSGFSTSTVTLDNMYQVFDNYSSDIFVNPIK